MSSLGAAARGRINQYLGIRNRDWPLLLLMLGHVFVALTLTISLRSMNSGIFLAAFPATVYPWYFLAEAVLSFILSVAYGNLAPRLSRRRETLGLLWGFAALLLLGRLLLFQQQSWANFALPVCCDSISSLLLIQGWTLYGDCVDSRKARKIFPLIGLGGTCGGIFGGWLASQLVHVIGTENLLFVELLLLGLIGIGATALLKRATVPEQKMEAKLEQGREGELSLLARGRQVLASVLSNRLLVRVLGILICVRVASTILDYQMQLQLKAHFNQNGITAFMGTYFAVTSLVTLIIQLTLENRIINKHGVVWGMGSTPLSLGIGLGGFLMAPSLMSAAIAKFFEQITRNSLFKTAVELVYIPFESSLRRRLRVLVNGMLSLTTVPLASVTIMVFSGQMHVLLTIALVFAALGLLLSILLQGPYTRKLHDSLMRRHLMLTDAEEGLQQQMSVSAEAIEQQLTRGDIGMILFALDLLKQQPVPIAPDKLKPLFFHANPYVREGALLVLGRQGAGPEHLQLALDILAHEREPRVREACLELLRRLGDESLNDQILPYLEDASLPVRAEAVLCLFTKGGIEGILAGGESLRAMSESGSEAELAHAAYIIGEIGIRYFRSDYIALLQHPAPRVKRAALVAAAVSLPPEMLPELLPLLADRSLARLARKALARLDLELVLPASLDCLRASEDLAPQDAINWQLELIRLIASYNEAPAIEALMDLLAEPDIRIKHQVLQGLNQLRRQENFEPEPFRDRIHTQLRREFYFGYHYFNLLVQIRKQPGDPLRSRFLQSEIKHRIHFVQEMLFRLLSLLYPSDEIYKAYLNFRSQSSHFRALSLEVLSYTLTNDLMPLVMTFLDDLPYENKVALGREFGLIKENTTGNWWENPVVLIDPWLAKLAIWSAHAGGLASDEAAKDNIGMFEILDKMFLLKQTPVFAKFSAEQLFPVASAARELYVPAQTTVLRQDQPGDAFYIISSGTVAVERSGVRVTLLSEKECFGELEVLNADPSLAAVKTLSECELLMISREDFLDLVEEYPDFSRGLLEVLSERLAAHVLKLSRTRPLGGTGSLWAETGADKNEEIKDLGLRPQNTGGLKS